MTHGDIGLTNSNEPLSERYRKLAEKWVDEDNAARLLEETKTTVLQERKNKLVAKDPGMADAHAERMVKADPEWREWIEKMVAARTKANLSKVRMRYLEMRHAEHQSFEATKRHEMRL